MRNTPFTTVYYGERRSPAFNASLRLRSMTEETHRKKKRKLTITEKRAYNHSSSSKRLQMDGSIRGPAILTLSSASHIDRLKQWRSVEHWRSVRVKSGDSLTAADTPALRDTSITEQHSTAFTLLCHHTHSSFNPQRLTLNISPTGIMHSMHFFFFFWISLICEIVVYNPLPSNQSYHYSSLISLSNNKHHLHK